MKNKQLSERLKQAARQSVHVLLVEAKAGEHNEALIREVIAWKEDFVSCLFSYDEVQIATLKLIV